MPPAEFTLFTNKVRVALVIKVGSDGNWERSNLTKPELGVPPPMMFRLTAVP